MILLCLLLVTFLIYYKVFYNNTRKFRKLMKEVGSTSILSVPILGAAYNLIGNNQTRMKAIQALGREATKAGGVTAGWFGPFPYVLISDAAAADVVLKESLEKDYLMKLFGCLIGNGLIVAPLSVWRERRRILSPTFSFLNLRKFVTVFSKQSHIMVEQLKKNVGKGPFPIGNYLALNNMSTVCETIFGVQMNVQNNPEHPFLNSFNQGSNLVVARMCQPLMHSDIIFKLLPQYRKLKKAQKVLFDTIDKIITKKHKENRDAKDINQKISFKPFLELLMESSLEKNGSYDDKVLREETLTLAVAGTDTSAAAAGFTLLLLAKYQDVQAKVYQELLDVFGDSTEELTADSLRELEYMEVVIKEAMRLYTPVPLIARYVTHDVTLPSGVILPSGCGIFMNIWALHRNKKYWGEDAEVFRPERFLDTPFKHPAQYMPFSFGPRSCPGNRYAMLSMKTTLATLLKQYHVLPVDEEPRVSFEIMMRDADNFRVQIELRNSTNCRT